MNISLISLNTSCLNNDTIELYALTIFGHFDGTPYHQGLAELCLIMTLPLSVFDRAKIY